ncbi:MAG: hypothetical protein ACLRSW_12435 [Christensenellaceae bacterium]
MEPVSFDLTDSGVCYFQNYDEVIYIGLKAEGERQIYSQSDGICLAWYIDGKLVESSQILWKEGKLIL